MIKVSKAIVLSLSCIVSLAACGQMPQVTPPTSDSWDYPSKPPAWTGLPDKRPVTRVLDKAAAQKIIGFTPNKAIKFNNSKLSFQPMGTSTVPIDSKILPGMILMSAPTDAAPYGFLQKVISVTNNSDNTMTIETGAATLAEAIAGADIKPGDVQTTRFKVPIEVAVAPGTSLQDAMPTNLYGLNLPKIAPQASLDVIPLLGTRQNFFCSTRNESKVFKVADRGGILWVISHVNHPYCPLYPESLQFS
jgi:hypothetical protein